MAGSSSSDDILNIHSQDGSVILRGNMRGRVTLSDIMMLSRCLIFQIATVPFGRNESLF